MVSQTVVSSMKSFTSQLAMVDIVSSALTTQR